jgi:glycolate oxidase iron-sulfur subunit
METNIPASKRADPAVQAMDSAIKSCVHCGFCLPTCPTYLETGSELDSPRGRIMLMKGALEDTLPIDSTLVSHIDRCLGCLACVTACPSGVQYNELIDNFRPLLEEEYSRAPLDAFTRRLLIQVLPYPNRFRLATAMGKFGSPLAGMMPKSFQAMLSLLPTKPLPAPLSFPEVIPAEGKRRARVALLIGCVQSVLAPEINAATIRVLTRNGVEVIIPREQGCCGALANHSGQEQSALAMARKTLAAFPTDVDAIISNAAGCGSMLKAYDRLLTDQADAAKVFVSRVKDVCEFLSELGFAEAAPFPERKTPIRVAYHDACHLGHAQGVRLQPRALLASLPGVEVIELPEADICCGSAGIYNITQPEMARQLLDRKINNILSTGATTIVSGNIGCLTQIRSGLEKRGQFTVDHTITFIDAAYQLNDL